MICPAESCRRRSTCPDRGSGAGFRFTPEVLRPSGTTCFAQLARAQRLQIWIILSDSSMHPHAECLSRTDLWHPSPPPAQRRLERLSSSYTPWSFASVRIGPRRLSSIKLLGIPRDIEGRCGPLLLAETGAPRHCGQRSSLFAAQPSLSALAAAGRAFMWYLTDALSGQPAASIPSQEMVVMVSVDRAIRCASWGEVSRD